MLPKNYADIYNSKAQFMCKTSKANSNGVNCREDIRKVDIWTDWLPRQTDTQSQYEKRSIRNQRAPKRKDLMRSQKLYFPLLSINIHTE